MQFRWRAKVQVEARSSFFTLGPGRTLPLLDRSLLVDHDGRPVVPASSLRGRCRAHLERLLKAWGYPVCSPPAPERTCPHNPEVWSQLPQGENFCLACRVFGSPWRESAVYFTDLTLVDGVAGVPDRSLVDERVGVAIDRRLGAAEERRLFFSETTAPGLRLRFVGELEALLGEVEMAWLLAALRCITHLGGGKAKGLARATVTVKDLVRIDQDGQVATEDANVLLRRVLGDRTSASLS